MNTGKTVFTATGRFRSKHSGGEKNGYEIAAEAFSYHRSQIRLGWKLDNDGTVSNNKGVQDYSISLFGLFHTTVGEDTGTGDFMEHIKDE